MQALTSGQTAPEPAPITDIFSGFAKAYLDKLKKAGVDGNTIKFHECCFTFSTKKLRKRLGHPDQDAPTFRRWIGRHNVKNVEDFAALLRKLSATRTDGKAGELPTWNAPHPAEAGLGKREVLSADPEPPAEPEQPAEQPLNQQPSLQDLLQENQRLRQQLHLERTAVLEHEQRFIIQEFMLHKAIQLGRRNGVSYQAMTMYNEGRQMAAAFKAAHPELHTLGNLPRPDDPIPPQPQLPKGPDFQTLVWNLLPQAFADPTNPPDN
jgi:hypothetical protein